MQRAIHDLGRRWPGSGTNAERSGRGESSPSVEGPESTAEPGEEEPEASVVKVSEMVRACTIYDTVLATVIVELHNEGTGWAKLGGGDYTIYDEDENVLGTGGFALRTRSSSRPVQPGTSRKSPTSTTRRPRTSSALRPTVRMTRSRPTKSSSYRLRNEAQARGVRRWSVHHGHGQERVVRGHNHCARRLHLPERKGPPDRLCDDQLD